MQAKGYIKIDCVIHKLIIRNKKDHRQLKLRSSGPSGVHFIQVEEYLSHKENLSLIEELIRGEQIKIPLE